MRVSQAAWEPAWGVEGAEKGRVTASIPACLPEDHKLYSKRAYFGSGR